jgi:GNAT superfamily N-acetyltransferase
VLHLRDAGPEDEAFVVGLVPRFVEHGVAGGHTAAEVIAGTGRVLSEALRAPRDGDVFWIADDDAGRPAGFVYAVIASDFFSGEPCLHVSEIAVARSGGGVGAAMMDAVERRARERGCRFVTLNVVEENRAGQRFYERLGFDLGHRHYVKRVT